MNQAKRYHIYKKTWGAIGWMLVVAAVLCMVGVIVCLVMLGVGESYAQRDILLGSLCGGFAVGVALFGGTAFLSLRKNAEFEKKELDTLELEDGENSFFVGEGTLLTFEEGQLRIHGTTRGGKTVLVPYGEVRLFSVCTRLAPKEKGVWSVVFEIPARYLLKEGRAKKTDPPVLVQTDAKPRLYDCIDKFGLKMLGEAPSQNAEKKKFERLKTFVLPDTQKRRRAIYFLVGGLVVFAGGIAAALLWQYTIGAIVCVLGAYIAIKAAFSYRRSKALFVVYREGIYYREPRGTNDIFLKWEEIESVSRGKTKDGDAIRMQCPYGAYEFPVFQGAFEYMEENFPERCGK